MPIVSAEARAKSEQNENLRCIVTTKGSDASFVSLNPLSRCIVTIKGSDATFVSLNPFSHLRRYVRKLESILSSSRDTATSALLYLILLVVLVRFCILWSTKRSSSSSLYSFSVSKPPMTSCPRNHQLQLAPTPFIKRRHTPPQPYTTLGA
jgi:hypothetical protein